LIERFGKRARSRKPESADESMEEKRPIGVIVFAIWSLLAGVLVGWDGLVLFFHGKKGLDDAWGAPPDEVSVLWLPFFLSFVIIGIVWILTGAACCISALALPGGSEGGRKTNIVSVIIIFLGWIVLKGISLRFQHFDDPAPVIGIIIALPMLYFWTAPVRGYCARATGVKPS
jgi:hypothetical protein